MDLEISKTFRIVDVGTPFLAALTKSLLSSGDVILMLSSHTYLELIVSFIALLLTSVDLMCCRAPKSKLYIYTNGSNSVRADVMEKATLVKTVRDWGVVVIAIFALNAFSLNFGCFSPVFLRLIGVLSLIAIIGLCLPSLLRRSLDRKLLVGAALIVLSFIVLLTFQKVEFWLISLPIFVCGLGVLASDVKTLPVISLGSMIYAISYITCLYVPVLWRGINYLSLFFSSSIGKVVGTPISLGPSVSGIWISISFFFCIITFFFLAEERSKKQIAGSILGIVSAFVIYILIDAFWMSGEKATHSSYMLFILSLASFIPAMRFEIKPVSVERLNLISKSRVMLVGVVFVSLLLISITPYTYGREKGRIIVYERDSNMGFELPEFPKENEIFTPYQGFSAGAIGHYLRTTGYDVVDLNDTNPMTLRESLKGADVLIMMNLEKQFNPTDLEAICDFVKGGGSLLICGDHTGMFVENEEFERGRDYLNDVLWPTGIRINHDTADFMPGNWKYGVAFLPHPVTKGLGYGITASSVGASLDISGDARPIIVGKYAFSDNPDTSTPGHLGNREYEKDEQLGDLIIAASDTYGRGNILVFGDTSYFFNTAVPFLYKLLDNSVAWLMSERSVSLSILPWAGLALLVLLILFIFISVKSPAHSSSSLLPAFLSIAVALSLITSGFVNGSLIKTPELENGNIAWIDNSHINRIDSEGYSPSSIDGLIVNLMRNSYMPLVLNESFSSENVLKGSVLIIIAPTKSYTNKEVSMAKSFVSNGGVLILSTGVEDKRAVEPILNAFDMDVGSLPLGSVPWIMETHGTSEPTVTPENLEKYWHKPKFVEAYPAYAKGEHTSLAWIEYRGEHYNLILEKAYGSGRVILIGDSRFLLNENLEYLTQGPGIETKAPYQLQWLGNIELLRYMLSKRRR